MPLPVVRPGAHDLAGIVDRLRRRVPNPRRQEADSLGPSWPRAVQEGVLGPLVV